MSPPSGALPVPLKPVRVNVPSPVSMTCGLPLSACSWATVRVRPPILTLVRPSGLPTVMLPAVVSLVSPALVSPRSSTLTWPVTDGPLPSTGTMLGPPSVVPLMVMVSVVLLGSPSASVIV